MSKALNTWNKIRYTPLVPIYDWVAGILEESRKKSLESLHIQQGAKVLIIGAGTGLDLEHLPDHCEITATDITPAMIQKVKKRNAKLKKNTKTMVMDGQNLSFADEIFDIVILHLILTVIPDPVASIKEAERVLKKGGQIAVFDKFIKHGKSISFGRRFANLFTNVLFSNITRYFEEIVKHTSLVVVSDIPANFKGNFRRVLLRKP